MATYKSDTPDDDRNRSPLSASTGSGRGLTGSASTSGSGLSGSRSDLDDGRVQMGSSGETDDNRAARGTGSYAGNTGTDARYDERYSGGHVGPGPEVMAAATLTGDDVVNGARENLGTIQSIMLDVPSGRIAYAVLASGGFLGMGEKLYAIPWRALKLDTDNHCFVLNVDKEQLQNAPGFDKDDWPSMADQQWASQIHSYYGERPYWE